MEDTGRIIAEIEVDGIISRHMYNGIDADGITVYCRPMISFHIDIYEYDEAYHWKFGDLVVRFNEEAWSKIVNKTVISFV